MKTIQFSGSALDDIKAFPDQVKQRIGYQLHRIQIGEEPGDWKPMRQSAPGSGRPGLKLGISTG